MLLGLTILTRCTVQGLPAGSILHDVRVRAKNLAGWGEYSQEPLTVMTAGKLVAWGENDFGQLGVPDLVMNHPLVDVHQTFDLRVEDMACGATHTVILADGKVFTWGQNKHGQLGRFTGEMDFQRGEVELSGFFSTQTGSAVPGINSELSGMPSIETLRQDGPNDYLGSLGPTARSDGKCVRVAAGYNFSMVLTDKGEIFVFGQGRHGVLAQGDELSKSSPQVIDSLSVPGYYVENIFCGEKHCACIVRYGQALTWGCGGDGQLGHSSPDDEYFPRKVEHLAHVSVRTISCGSKHTCFLTADDELYTCGSGKDGKLGHGDERTYLYPKKVEALQAVKEVCCGDYHTVCFDEKGIIYTFGNGTRGQLGYRFDEVKGLRTYSTLGSNTFGTWKSLLPRAVVSLRDNKEIVGFRQVRCGPTCTFAVSNDNRLWCWGEGTQVDSVFGSKMHLYEPKMVTKFQKFHVSDITLGRSHVLVILTSYPSGIEKQLYFASEQDNDVTDFF
eukprot:123916-Hanusia_phi.AAC.6